MSKTYAVTLPKHAAEYVDLLAAEYETTGTEIVRMMIAVSLTHRTTLIEACEQARADLRQALKPDGAPGGGA